MTAVIELNGGLGNQLFQTALACEMRARGHEVLLNGVSIDPGRGLQVRSIADSLGLQVEQAVAANSRLRRALAMERTLIESSSRFDPLVLKQSSRRNIRLRGYWQSEQYFPTVGELVKHTYLTVFERHLTPRGDDLLSLASEPGTVSMHIRRGDYVTNPSAAATHGVLSLDYYRTALKRFGDPSAVLVFSDDLDWVEETFGGGRFHVVSPEFTTEAAGELRLMAACSRHIIANSSFSWWGAWLGGPEHDVIAPAQWFVSNEYDASDIVPIRWKTL